jgi:phosphatidate cytidylyltransferase
MTLFLTSILWKHTGAHAMFTVFAFLLGFFAIKEFLNMLAQLDKKSLPTITAIGSALFLASILLTKYINIENIDLNLGILVTLVVVPWIILLCSINDRGTLEKVITSVTALFMITLPLSFVAQIYMIGEVGVGDTEPTYVGRYLLLFMVLVTKSGDIGAYCTGTLSNKILKGKNHKIVPRISPKKSWEGTIGGLIVSVIVAFSLRNILPIDSNLVFIISAGVLLFIGGFCGDLMESTLKRITGVKDSGNSIPGMGGVLDFLDSLILNAPLFYLLIKYLGN